MKQPTLSLAWHNTKKNRDDKKMEKVKKISPFRLQIN